MAVAMSRTAELPNGWKMMHQKDFKHKTTQSKGYGATLYDTKDVWKKMIQPGYHNEELNKTFHRGDAFQNGSTRLGQRLQDADRMVGDLCDNLHADRRAVRLHQEARKKEKADQIAADLQMIKDSCLKVTAPDMRTTFSIKTRLNLLDQQARSVADHMSDRREALDWWAVAGRSQSMPQLGTAGGWCGSGVEYTPFKTEAELRREELASLPRVTGALEAPRKAKALKVGLRLLPREDVEWAVTRAKEAQDAADIAEANKPRVYAPLVPPSQRKASPKGSSAGGLGKSSSAPSLTRDLTNPHRLRHQKMYPNISERIRLIETRANNNADTIARGKTEWENEFKIFTK